MAGKNIEVKKVNEYLNEKIIAANEDLNEQEEDVDPINLFSTNEDIYTIQVFDSTV